MKNEACENCGKPVFFNYSMWSSGPNGGRTTHGYGKRACEDAAAALERMPVALDAAISALIETSEAARRLIYEGEDEEYADVARLQGALHAACDAAAGGIDRISAALGGRA